MECREYREMLSAYVDGAVSAGEKAAVEEHLKICLECRGFLADLKTT